MIDYLDLEDLLEIVARAVGDDAVVRDRGLLEYALARPRATVFGEDAYPGLHTKAAALLQSLAQNHAVVDGNKRLAWTACLTLLAINGFWIRAAEDDRFELVIGVATGDQTSIEEIAELLRSWSRQAG